MARDKDTPSSLVFAAARGIVEDMKDGVDSLSEDLVDYIDMLSNMADALRETKRNLEKYALPMSPQRSRERKQMRKKIQSIQSTILTCLSLKKTLELAMDDVYDTMSPSGWDPTTRDFLSKIMEPNDVDLRRIEEEGGDMEGYDEDEPQ
jgi:hypothetical protein